MIERLIFRVGQKEEMNGGIGSKKTPLGNSNVANVDSTQASSIAQASSLTGGKLAAIPT
mgnify:CR=1 FL=1